MNITLLTRLTKLDKVLLSVATGVFGIMLLAASPVMAAQQGRVCNMGMSGMSQQASSVQGGARTSDTAQRPECPMGMSGTSQQAALPHDAICPMKMNSASNPDQTIYK